MHKLIIRLTWLLLVTSLFIMIAPINVYASNIAPALYRVVITITNNGTSTLYNQTAIFTLNTSDLQNNSYLNSSCNNSAVLTPGGSDTAYAFGVAANTTGFVFLPSILPNSSVSYALYLGGQSSMGGNIVYFPGITGLTIADANTMELSTIDGFINVNGYFDMNYTVNKFMFTKTGSIRMWVSANNTVTVGVGATYATNISGTVNSGLHAISFWSDYTNNLLKLVIDGVVVDSVAYAPIPDNSNPWAIATNNCLSYLNYFSLNSTNAPLAYGTNVSWQDSAIFVDSTGHGNNGTPSFRSASSDSHLSASITAFDSLNKAVATNWSLTSYGNAIGSMPGMPPEMYGENGATFPGAGLVNGAADSGTVPRAIAWFCLGMIACLLAGVFIFEGTKSLMAQYIILMVMVLIGALIHVWPLWMLVPFGLMGAACVLSGKVWGY